MNITFSWDGKYYALLKGFVYRNGRQHPSYNWVKRMPSERVAEVMAEELNRGVTGYEKRTADRLLAEWRELITNDPSRPSTVTWYDWQKLAASTSYTLS